MSEVLGIIDVHSHGVSGALLAPPTTTGHAGRCREPVLVHHEDISFEINQEPELMFGQIVDALRRTAAAVRRGSGGRHIAGHCFLSAPFYLDRTKIIRWRHKEPRLFTARNVGEVLDREGKKFLADGENYHLLEKRILRLTLNGYPVPLGVSARATEAEIAMYFSATPGALLNRLSASLRGERWRSVVFHPFSFMLYRVVPYLLPNLTNLTLVNVEEEITEVTVVSQGVLLETFSFPLGSNHLIRQYAANFRTVFAEAESALKLYFAGTQTAAAAQRIKNFLREQADAWLKLFQDNLDQALDQFLLSPEVLVLTQPSFAPLYVGWLSRTSSNSSLVINNSPLHARALDDTLFQSYCGGGLNPPADARLVLGGIFCDNIKS